MGDSKLMNHAVNAFPVRAKSLDYVNSMCITSKAPIFHGLVITYNL